MFKFSDRRREDKRFWSERWQAFPEFNDLISSWMHFGRDITINLVFSMFTSIQCQPFLTFLYLADDMLWSKVESN
jgi:hypothetical protein